ncbi:hypothetical protein J2T19_005668 [Paenibacillus tundrae]|uniref:Uncharacterized protein n=1 Tax=Paenibacillus tundrae TaxID=528187 RepID=A0ABT9WLR5_9BACL|nr:hypothetical protein [Paenibacillus tundrae]
MRKTAYLKSIFNPMINSFYVVFEIFMLVNITYNLFDKIKVVWSRRWDERLIYAILVGIDIQLWL